jgi:putative ABC transport system permease protein
MMIKTDVKLSFRRLVKERLYSIINVGGLAVSMAAALLILMYLLYELSYDRYHPDHERIYRVASDMTVEGENLQFAVNSVPLGPLMVNQVAGVTDFLRIFPTNFFFRNIIYRYEDKHFFESAVFGADSSYFDFFEHQLVYGKKENALRDPFSFIMTRSMAERYFGNEDPVGRFIQLDGAGSFRVTAVIEDVPLNSHFQFTGLMSMSTMTHLRSLLEQGFMQGVSWEALEQAHGSRLIWLYVKTTAEFNPQGFLEEQWPQLYEDHISSHYGGAVFENTLLFQPMADVHLHSKLEYEMTSGTGAVTMMSPDMIRIFFVVAFFLLLLASINYTNIAISRFNRRSKEVGVKKVMGAGRARLITQFLAESLLTTLFALFLSLLLVEIALPTVNTLLSVELSANVFSSPVLLFVLFAVAVFVGLVAGLYPALYFSSFTPTGVLRFQSHSGKSSLMLKKTLIILQFIISIFMVIATTVVASQLAYINSKELGYDQQHVVIVELQDEASRSGAEVLMNHLLQSPLVEDVVVSNYFPAIITMNNSVDAEAAEGFRTYTSHVAQVSPDYKSFLGLEMAEGRFFDWHHQTDFTDAVVINEAARRHFGWEEGLGKVISSGFVWSDGSSSENRKVIGVMRDFHYSSLSRPIEPMIWYPMRNAGSYLQVRLEGKDLSAGIGVIEKEWRGFAPNSPLEYYFLEDVIGSMYNSQRVLSTFFAVFAWLCIIIAFLGLYGLSAYAVEQRTREIGIRKVLGARFPDVLFILGREFIWLILTAFVMASVLGYYFMSSWLQSFSYHITLTAWPFVIAFFTAFLVAFFAIGFHAWKATRLNATEALKYE